MKRKETKVKNNEKLTRPGLKAEAQTFGLERSRYIHRARDEWRANVSEVLYINTFDAH